MTKQIVYKNGQLVTHFDTEVGPFNSSAPLVLGEYPEYSRAAISPTLLGMPPEASALYSQLEFTLSANESTLINQLAFASTMDVDEGNVEVTSIEKNGQELLSVGMFLPFNGKQLVLPAGALGSNPDVHLYNLDLQLLVGDDAYFLINRDDELKFTINFPESTFGLVASFDGAPYPMNSYSTGFQIELGVEGPLYVHDIELDNTPLQPPIIGAGFRNVSLAPSIIGRQPLMEPMFTILPPDLFGFNTASGGFEDITIEIPYPRLYGVRVGVMGLGAGQTATVRFFGSEGGSGLQYEANFTDVDDYDTAQAWRYRNTNGLNEMYIQLENTGGTDFSGVMLEIEAEPF